MEWSAFIDAHYRSHLVEAQLAGVAAEAAMPVLEDHLKSRSGNYAFQRQGRKILVAFERDVDADGFAILVRATRKERSAEWSSRRNVRLDTAGLRRVSSATRRERSKP